MPALAGERWTPGATRPTMDRAMDAPEDRAGAISRFREGPLLLEAAVAGLPDAVLDAVPSGGGWTIRQIVHHVVDGDDIWKSCIKMAIGNEQAEFALGWYWSLPQETWGERWAYGRRSLDESLVLLKANRGHVLQLLESVPEAWDRAVSLRRRDGQMERVPVGFVVQMQADHVFHHLRRIREILAGRAGA
jgi:uncharacterized damage-inducible protein DinB